MSVTCRERPRNARLFGGVRRARPGARAKWWWLWAAAALVVGGFLLFAHGCHGDEDTELLVTAVDGSGPSM
jgi:hypothetical protein